MNYNIKFDMAENNLQKYENWRAITESDFVTMYIKTWFAFVATLKDIYHVEDVDKIITRGDSVYIRPFLDDFEKSFYKYNNFDAVKDDMLRVYQLGRSFVLNNSRYHRFFKEDFYELNLNYKCEKETDEYQSVIKLSQKYILTIWIKFKDTALYRNNTPLIIACQVDFDDIINAPLNSAKASDYLSDEGNFINEFLSEMQKKVSSEFLNEFSNSDYEKTFKKKDYEKLESLCRQEIYNFLLQALSNTDDTQLFHQVPCQNYIYKANNGEHVPEIASYKWFIKFVYFLRNALFHEIINPMENFWQDIFKHAYLALKEVLDANISFLHERELISKI